MEHHHLGEELSIWKVQKTQRSQKKLPKCTGMKKNWRKLGAEVSRGKDLPTGCDVLEKSRDPRLGGGGKTHTFCGGYEVRNTIANSLKHHSIHFTRRSPGTGWKRWCLNPLSRGDRRAASPGESWPLANDPRWTCRSEDMSPSSTYLSSCAHKMFGFRVKRWNMKYCLGTRRNGNSNVVSSVAASGIQMPPWTVTKKRFPTSSALVCLSWTWATEPQKRTRTTGHSHSKKHWCYGSSCIPI